MQLVVEYFGVALDPGMCRERVQLHAEDKPGIGRSTSPGQRQRQGKTVPRGADQQAQSRKGARMAIDIAGSSGLPLSPTVKSCKLTS